MTIEPIPVTPSTSWGDRLIGLLEGDLWQLTPSERAEAVAWQEAQTHEALGKMFHLLLGAGACTVGLATTGLWPSAQTTASLVSALAIATVASIGFARSKGLVPQGFLAILFLVPLVFVISSPNWPQAGVAAMGPAWLLPAIGIPLLARLRSVAIFTMLLISAVATFLTMYPLPESDIWAVALYLGLSIASGILLRRLRSDMILRYRRMVQDAHERAIRDPLTGVLNRHGWQLGAQAALDRCATRKETATLIFIDLDHFKTLNDTHGHTVGDQALRRVGLALDARTHQGVVARIGGEEFALILPGCDVAATQAFLRRVRKDLAQHSPQLTFSAGIAAIESTHDHLAERMSAADAAMYVAKAAGRDQTVVALAPPHREAPAHGMPAQAIRRTV